MKYLRLFALLAAAMGCGKPALTSVTTPEGDHQVGDILVKGDQPDTWKWLPTNSALTVTIPYSFRVYGAPTGQKTFPMDGGKTITIPTGATEILYCDADVEFTKATNCRIYDGHTLDEVMTAIMKQMVGKDK